MPITRIQKGCSKRGATAFLFNPLFYKTQISQISTNFSV